MIKANDRLYCKYNKFKIFTQNPGVNDWDEYNIREREMLISNSSFSLATICLTKVLLAATVSYMHYLNQNSDPHFWSTSPTNISLRNIKLLNAGAITSQPCESVCNNWILSTTKIVAALSIDVLWKYFYNQNLKC